MFRTRRLALAWIASLAVLLASFAPLLAHAFGGTTPTPWTEICTGLGVQRIASNDAAHDTGSPKAPAHLLEHCPFCSLHVDLLGVPPAAPTLHAPVAAGHVVQRVLPHAATTGSVWATAQPRAPPRTA
jgi:hypothetical protein